MDTEGCELENLRAYKHLKDVHVLMLEWHRQDDYRALLTWLPTYGFELVRDDAKGRWISDRNLIFVRRQPRSTVVPVEDESEVVFRCPRSSLDMIAELHGYDLGTLPDLHAPVILDVGAHVGGFAWYALKRWPGARALCFEPHPTTLGMLRANTKGLPVDARHSAVVWPLKAPTVRLYEGVHGRHECSLRGDIVWGPDKTDPKPHVSQKLDTWVDVPAVDASELPPCDVLKIDCEGGELEVLGGYKHLKGVKVLITEAHAVGGDVQGQAAAIRMAAESAGLRWIGPDPIIARFVR
jgi:FkbM family methyltransferase